MSPARPRPDATRQAPASRPERRRGPRADLQDTRGTVLEAARARFAEHGYDGTKLRDVAADADVDVALISYFFGNKNGLFAAAMALDANPAKLVQDLIRDGTDGLGERLLRTFLSLWDAPKTGDPLLGLLRSAASHEQSAALLRGFVERELLGRLAAAIDAPQPELRAALAGSQMIGLIMARYVVQVEAIAHSDPETLVAAIGPTLQRYLTGDIAG